MKNVKDIVKNQKAHFVFYRDRALFYETDDGLQFPVPVDEAGSATFNAEEKAITLMRYVRKHLENTERARREQHAVAVFGAFFRFEPAGRALRARHAAGAGFHARRGPR